MPRLNPQRRPRHCMIVYAVYPLTETRVQREAEALLKHGYEVDVICIRWPGEKARDSYKGVQIYREAYQASLPFVKKGGLAERFLNYIRFFFSAAARVTWLHLQKSYDTIQVHNLPDFLVFCALIPRLMGTPVILDLHDLMPEFFAGRFGQVSSLGARLIRWQERLACRFTDHVITVSEHWRQALIQRGVPEAKCSVVMNVADDQIFHTNSNHRPPRQPGSEFRLIYHGSIHYRYGLDLAVRAVERVRQEIPGIHLLLIGEGEYLPHLKELIASLDLGGHVTVESLRLAEELPEIILSCDLGVVPYRSDVFTDGLLPTKLMEYAALGLPAVAARTTAIQAYFSQANSEFFEPGDADDLARSIARLYHDRDRLAELARGSRNFNQRYNWAEISAAYVSLVEQLARRELNTRD